MSVLNNYLSDLRKHVGPVEYASVSINVNANTENQGLWEDAISRFSKDLQQGKVFAYPQTGRYMIFCYRQCQANVLQTLI